MSRLDLRLDGIEPRTSSLQRLLKTAVITQSLLQVASHLHHLRHQEEDLLPERPNYGCYTTGAGLDTRGRCAPRAHVRRKEAKMMRNMKRP
jgi:hypothetical protein